MCRGFRRLCASFRRRLTCRLECVGKWGGREKMRVGGEAGDLDGKWKGKRMTLDSDNCVSRGRRVQGVGEIGDFSINSAVFFKIISPAFHDMFLYFSVDLDGNRAPLSGPNKLGSESAQT